MELGKRFNYKMAMQRLAASARTGDFSLDAMQFLSAQLGHPERAYPVVHIAGTNGKGSVTTKIAKALELSGLKVGVYTSPHLFSFCERICINKQMIAEEAVADGLQKLFALVDTHRLSLSAFEFTTLLGFNYFRKERVDIAVIETGLGGRLDATNIVWPQLTVITSISKDHTQLLGETLEEIAEEKSGIIKPGIPLILGPKAHFSAITQRAELLQAELIAVPHQEGAYDRENSEVARRTLHFLSHHFPISQEVIDAGICHRPPCRFEQIDNVIFDVAHNLHGFERLVEAIDIFYPNKAVRFLVGMCLDKEVDACLKVVKKRASHIHLTQSTQPRAAAPQELANHLVRLNYSHFTIEQTVDSAVQHAYLCSQENQELLVICGSFFIMADAKKITLDILRNLLFQAKQVTQDVCYPC